MAQSSPELLLLKFLPLTYHHSQFLAATLDFASFFTTAFLRAALFFLQLGCFGLDVSYSTVVFYVRDHGGGLSGQKFTQKPASQYYPGTLVRNTQAQKCLKYDPKCFQ